MKKYTLKKLIVAMYNRECPDCKHKLLYDEEKNDYLCTHCDLVL